MKLMLTQTRTEVNVFVFELDKDDAHLADMVLSDQDKEYLERKYCYDENGHYKNVWDCYGDGTSLTVRPYY